MPSYYQDVFGNLRTGDIAKSSDIHHIQRHIKDALKILLSDLHDGESYILGSDEEYKKSFILTPAEKDGGRYLDSKNSDFPIDESKYININHVTVKQPILKTKSSLYSIITNFRNTSDRKIPITCHLEGEDGRILATNTITLLPKQTSAFYEIIFDLKFYPTAPNIDYEEVIQRDGIDVAPRTIEEGYDSGYKEVHEKEEELKNRLMNESSVGLSKLYFVIESTNLNAADLSEKDGDEVIFDPYTSLGVYYNEQSPFPDKEVYMEIGNGKTFTLDNKNIYYKDVYANERTYKCSGGAAVIDGEVVTCLDTHVSIEGGNTKGNVLTRVYLDSNGHLRTSNKQASLTTNINDFVEDLDDPMGMAFLPIALILTYSNALYGTAKEPLVIQSGYNQLPPSHHERLRRIEKRIKWDEDVALPSRIKYTINGRDWIDDKGESLVNLPFANSSKDSDVETLSNENIFITTDEKGNVVVKLSDAVTQTIPVTLKEKLTNSDGKEIELEETDVLNISSFSSLTNMTHDSENGTLTLEVDKSKSNVNGVGRTEEQAKLTELNPWDDSEENRVAEGEYEVNEREYRVISGKNGITDRSSAYPGMTFYTDTNYVMKKLNIPIHKFQNCSSVKFYIWRRQDTNDKKNEVWLQSLLYTSKDFSLKKAKEKDKYQYMDDGFTIEFENDGLSLKKGQYVIIAVPTPKSESGSLFVETYKPKESKDFCIKYTGTANAAHFRLAERYQEIWYNSASALVFEENYYEKGTAISKTLTWTEKGLERIASVKPVVDDNLTVGNKTKDSYDLYVNTGGDWIKVTPNEDNIINNGGATTFKWKIVFKGDGKSTPKLSYNKDKNYAIKFILTREKAASFLNESENEDLNKNMCITSVPFDGNEILRNYIGDMNFALTNSRFEEYEFARVWADNEINDNLLIDIQASDKQFNYNIKKDDEEYSSELPLWSLHYCDLKLDDFEKMSVDYSDFDEEIEYDENNLRLKLDSNHSYNDNDIQILALKDFTKNTNDIDESEDKTITFVNKESIEDNQLYLKKTFDKPIDLTKYTGLKFKFNIDAEETSMVSMNGLGIYISSAKEDEVPSDIKYRPENVYKVLSDTDIVPSEIDPDISSASYYDGNLIAIIHEIDSDKDGDKAYPTGYYKYVQKYDEKKGKYIYHLEQVFDLRTYNLYKVGPIVYSKDNNECEIRIELDQDSNNLKQVKEIGIISLNDEKLYNVEEISTATKLSAEGLENGVIQIKLTDSNDNPIPYQTIKYGENGELALNENGTGTISLNGNSDEIFIFEGCKKIINEETNEYIIYSGCSINVSYDFVQKAFRTETVSVSYDESMTANTIKETKLVATNIGNKKVKLKLTDVTDEENIIPLAGKEINCGSSTKVTTNGSGEATITLNGEGTITASYNAELINNEEDTENNEEDTENNEENAENNGENNNENTNSILYKPSGVKITYDFRTPSERVQFKELNISYDKLKLTLESVKAISEEYLKIYDPEKDNKIISFNNDVVSIYHHNNITLNSSTYDSKLEANPDNDIEKITKTTPYTTQINIKHQDNNLLLSSKTICYINNPFQGTLTDYKHIGIQIASDVYIPKDCLKINICSKTEGKDIIASVNLPTMNSIYYPNTAGDTINLSQIFKKFDIDEEEIKSISISTTSHFYNFINKVVKDKPSINLFLGKIVLYRAETIPIYHNKMRFKFYSTTNGEIDHNGQQISSKSFSIRKIGAVLDYH